MLYCIQRFPLNEVPIALLEIKIGSVSLKVTVSSTSGSEGSGRGIVYYAPITLSNQQSSGTSSGFQQMIYFNPSTYSSNEMANLSNIEFTADAPIGTSGNVPLYAWIESGASSSATNTVAWVNLGSVILNPAPQSYISVNVINSQNTATGTGFQQMIYFNPSSYSSYEASDLGNIRFYNGNTELYSWCESGCTSASSNAVFWINTGSLNIGPNSYATVNMIFESTSTEYDGAYAGEAPQLSQTYGRYDNGANVFTNYWNFAGTSLPSGITKGSTITVSINNGITISGGTLAAGDSVTTNSLTVSPPFIVEAYGTLPVSGYAWAVGASDIAGSNTKGASGFFGSSGSTLKAGQSTTSASTVGGNFGSSSTTGVWTTETTSTTSSTFYLNYGSAFTESSEAPTYPVYLSLVFFNNGATITYNWFRTRSYPPNGVMPTIQLSVVKTETSGQNTATIYLNFLPNNSPVTSGYTGYAPQLYCASGCFQTSYAQYDTGTNIFNYYNINPISTSGWTITETGAGQTNLVPSGNPYMATNAFYSYTCQGGGVVFETSIPSLTTNEIISYLTYVPSSSNGADFYFLTNSEMVGQVNLLGIGSGGTFGSGIESASPCSYSGGGTGNSITFSSSVWYKEDIVISGTTATDYVGLASNSLSELGSEINSQSISINGNYIGFDGYYPSSSVKVYYNGFIIRKMPPNNIMPSFNLGGII